MSFPIDYQFDAVGESSKYRLVGNAVCPKLSGALAESILKEQGKKIKSNFENRGKIPLEKNLNGTKRKLKSFKTKKYESKFADHVPNLKIKNYRVSLENLESNFKKKNIIWNCVLHHGTGKNASKLNVFEIESRDLIKEVKGFSKFDSDLKKIFSKLVYTSESLHEDFLKNPLEEGPRKILIEIKRLIDKNYPESKFSKVELIHRKRGFNIGNGTMPLRIGLALYGCSLFVKMLSQK